MHKMPKVTKRPKQKPPQLTVNVTKEQLDELETVKCSNCQGIVFNNAFIMRKLPVTHPLNTVGRPDSLLQPVRYCLTCRKVLD